MKTSLSVIFIGLLSLPLMEAWVVKNPSLPLNETNQNNDTTSIVVPTDTVLYEKYVCVGNPDGLKLLVPGSCSKYYECFNGIASVNSCAYLTPYYDPITASCVAESSCEEKDITVPGGPVGCTGVCCGKNPGLYANSANNTQFYFCNNNVGILHSCCSGEQFNPITSACDVPANCPE